MTFRVLSLFAGIGGFDLGLERTGGFKTVAFCEIDPFCRRVLARHWPEVPCYEDVRELTAQEVAPIDVICGGFPCQDLSFAGAGAGIYGERSGLWSEIVRLAGDLRPTFILLENVAALASRGLGDVLGALASLGYDAEWHCIPASAVGAPHERDRIWIIAHPSRDGCGQGIAGRLDSGVARELEQALSTPADATPLLGPAQLREQQDRAISSYWRQSWSEYAETLRGMDDGVRGRVDGLAALGNTLTPVIPELIGRAILSSHREAA